MRGDFYTWYQCLIGLAVVSNPEVLWSNLLVELNML